MHSVMMQNGVRPTTMLAAACLAAGLIVAPAIVGKGISDQAVACGGSRNTVQAEFDLDTASDVWREFPAMLRAPELEDDAGPVRVVVFKGNVDLSGMIGGRQDPVPAVADAICVTTSSREVYFYDGVSRAGSRFDQ